ncbi:AAA family ATPase [Streptomyces tanashiensis]|uniref:AAA family ATPase n=1 Tax=Streptomyces tanashiensis TaxID=67367 RepID=A0ABY6QTL6_9ACTN|nr:AAA family ATPase [Streptomyces tanashiensis]UZX20037.1 AAA family ATPase [Streptomyces tanashiensis]GGY43941.1 ATPase AAA [Streptomyces tanashiensis]
MSGDDRTGPDGLLGLLSALRARVAALVDARGAGDPTAGDPLRGLYVTEETARRIAESPPPTAARDHAVRLPDVAGADRLARLARDFGLTALDAHILVAALAPDVDRGFEALYGYLNDDVGRRRATVALALDLAGTGPSDPAARDRFHPAAPLRSGGLLEVEDEDRPLPGRALRVPERVVAHLLGDDGRLDAQLSGTGVELLAPAESETDVAATPLGARVVAAGPVTVHLRERVPGASTDGVVEALRAAGRPVLRYRPESVDEVAARALVLEARLRGAAVVVEPLPPRPGPLVRALASSGATVVLAGAEAPDPRWAPDADLVAVDTPGEAAGSGDQWHRELDASELDFDLDAATAPYRLSGDQVRRAARSARALAAFEGTPLTLAQLQRGARLVSAPLLDSHARRVRPAVGFADLVLPEEPLGLLRELTGRARDRDRVLGEWRLRRGGGRGRGVVALFAGESGTGKTLGAEVVAGELGLDLYVVDLSSVVDKYVGETEKNLERIFAEVDRTDCVLLFDEADAVFGKRSEVKSSHDRYANLESAYLLQRLEAFDGIAVLTTNLRANIDEAFTRRLDLVVDFPFPDPGQRVSLWHSCLAGTPRAEGVDEEIARCAEEFELAGGAIRSAAVTAGYLAAARGSAVTGEDVRAGARREYRKAGRLVPDAGAPWAP